MYKNPVEFIREEMDLELDRLNKQIDDMILSGKTHTKKFKKLMKEHKELVS